MESEIKSPTSPESKSAENIGPLREIHPQPAPPKKSAMRTNLQMILAVGLTGLVLAYLLLVPFGKSPSPNERDRLSAGEPVKPTGDGLIQIQSGHVIEKKLQIAAVEQQRITIPLLTVTGTVAASLRPNKSQSANDWQFSSPDALTTFTDWQRAKNDTLFTEKRLATVQELVEAKVKYQKDYEAQMVALGAKGGAPEHSIKKVKLDTIEAQLDGQKDIYEAENANRLARRSEASLALQLEQAGLEPDLLLSATPDDDIVMADIPLGSLSYVKVGQTCQATFVGIRSRVFDGKVNKIVPVISKERRSLRVLFVIRDPDDLLRPGMFAEIALGTDPREAILAPSEGIVHVGRADYFLVANGAPGQWRVTEVRVGEPYRTDVEVLEGLHEGDRVLGRGAVLLKPVVVRSLQMAAHAPSEVSR